jgi:IS5 family transposase
MNFRHLLKKHDLGGKIFDAINQFLEDSGVLMKEGSSIDATIIEAPSSTKNKLNKRGPEMHQTKKGNQ